MLGAGRFKSGAFVSANMIPELQIEVSAPLPTSFTHALIVAALLKFYRLF